ncbi:hypothetical protein CABS01_03350 [Colletotrichum abscissum]|uniref:uncharacterized protein n=1 Tax=Colletotrichum abscissum TaxID=1671311 RepID=UPI0027D632EA|nr:uncharacterized protein CABS01_03350 [Colletotrichum abscissum]KAK1478048.1 hypothetical protein CABS01_03350 [Colletotrichum abscissum]
MFRLSIQSMAVVVVVLGTRAASRISDTPESLDVDVDRYLLLEPSWSTQSGCRNFLFLFVLMPRESDGSIGEVYIRGRLKMSEKRCVPTENMAK